MPRMDAEPSTVLIPTTCRAAGCGKPAFGLSYCGTHAHAFEPAQAAACRVDTCRNKPLAHGLCRAHYARWARWKARVEATDAEPRDVEIWLRRDWARPIGETSGIEQANVSSRMLRSLYDRVEAHCEEDETMYDRVRQALEEYAKSLPDPTPKQLQELHRRRRNAKRRASRRN